MTDAAHDRACLERLRGGEISALEELYDRYSDLLYSLAVRIVTSAAEAEEVVQDTWVQAWRNAASYDAARGSVGAWLVTIARSRALDRVRSAGSRRRAETAAEVQAVADPVMAPADASRAVAENELGARITSALGRLDPQHREVLQLAYFTGLSQSEIAGRLGAPLGTIKSWTRQALVRMRELVPQEDVL